MPFAREHAKPLLGSAALHVGVLAALVLFAVQWRADPEPVPLAIEGTVLSADALPASLRGARPKPTPPAPVVQPAPEPEVTDAQAEATRAEVEALERAAEAERQRAAEAAQRQREADERRIEEARAREVAAAEKRKAEEAAAMQAKAEAEAKQKAAADARHKAEAEADAKRKAEAEAAERKAQQAQAAQDAKQKSAREAELQRALAAEEEGEAFDRSGIVDEYRALLVQTIERNWLKPPSARAGLECTLNVTQATGGTVVDVRVGACNGDQAVRESITNAVYRSSPLPAPRDPRAFQRQLVIVFKPTE